MKRWAGWAGLLLVFAMMACLHRAIALGMLADAAMRSAGGPHGAALAWQRQGRHWLVAFWICLAGVVVAVWPLIPRRDGTSPARKVR